MNASQIKTCIDLNKCKLSCLLKHPIPFSKIRNLNFARLAWTALFSHDLTCKAHAKLMSPLFYLLFSPPHSPSPQSKLMPHNTDRWIPANRVRRFVLKYQRPAGDSYHSSVCLCCADLCLSFSVLFPPSLWCSFSTSVHSPAPSYLPPFLFLCISISPQCVCFPGWREGRVKIWPKS